VGYLGDKFLMVLEGQEIRDRGMAGELLLRRADKTRGSRSERQVASIAGFQIFVADNFMQGPEILLKGATTYTAKATDTAHVTMRSVELTIILRARWNVNEQDGNPVRA